MNVVQIKYIDAKQFANDKTLQFKVNYIYYALVNEKGEKLSIIGLSVQKSRIFLHANYTPEKMRKKGYFSKLLKTMMDMLIELQPQKKTIAYCTKYSVGIYLKAGFDLKKVYHYRSRDIYLCQMDNKTAKQKEG